MSTNRIKINLNETIGFKVIHYLKKRLKLHSHNKTNEKEK